MTTDERNHQSTEDRVVVGVDGSANAERALEFAAHEAARRGALLEIVTSYHASDMVGSLSPPVAPLEEAAVAIAADAAARAEALEPGVVVKSSTVFGSPGPALVQLAEGASVVVVGTRGHGAVAGALLGSVSTYVVHHAPCTVMVVR